MERTPSHSLVAALTALRAAVSGVGFGLSTDGAEQARRTQRDLVDQIDDYLLPRLRQLDAPLLMVVGGSTGAGKSTIVNSLVGSPVSATGVIRPTTRSPVLVAHPRDRSWFDGDRVLPGLARTTGEVTGARALHVVTDENVPPGLAILDAPDIDSVVTENRELSRQLLAAADLWLFVTTASRYADAVPWELLHAAKARGTAVALVLNRVPPGAGPEVGAHLSKMLRDNGLGDAQLFTIQESPLGEADLLPSAAIAPVRRWLDALGADAQSRESVVRATLVGALDSLQPRVSSVAAHADAQRQSAADLFAAAQSSYERALDEIDDGISSGSLLRGEVLARWQDFVGTGEFMRSLESRIGVLRDRLRAALTGRPAAGTELKAAVESSVEALVRASADRAADRAYDSWMSTTAGRELLRQTGPDIARASTSLPSAVEREVRGWQGHVLELVAEQGASKRTAARFLSYSVNAAGLAVMVTVFAHTGGLTGGEVAVAGGTSALGQKLLEAVFGDQAVRALALEARTDLLTRMEHVLEAERARLDALVQSAAPAADAAAGLQAALGQLADARGHTPALARR